MKAKIYILVLTLAAVGVAAQSTNLTALLQQGLLEEQANGNLNAAINDYKSLAEEFDKNRQLAAIAVFRLGECYRAQNKTNEAVTQYQRVLREFPDQSTLATLSRQNLTGLGIGLAESQPSGSSDVKLWAAVKDLPKDQLENVLPTLAPDPVLASLIQRRSDAQSATVVAGTNPAVERIDKEIADRIDGIMQALKLRAELSKTTVAAVTEETSNDAGNIEDKEILRITKMMQSSPDLLSNGELVKAARADELRAADLLLSHGADVNGGSRGGAPLVAAAENGNVEMVKLLLRHGADINARGDSGGTALIGATRNGLLTIVELLLAHKADVNAAYTDVNGAETSLHLAAERGYANLTKLLLAAGANPNIENSNGRTPLSEAVDNGNPEIINMLLAAKTDPNTGRMDKPLLTAIHKQNITVAEMLLKAGANPNESGDEDWDQKWPDGRFRTYSPLWLAISSNELPMVKLLLEYKADATKIPLSQVTHSEIRNETEIAALLREHGAVDNPPNWDRIEVNRLSAKDPVVVFWKGSNDWNHFTLVETILNYYLEGYGYRHPLPPYAPPNYAEATSPKYFPGSVSIPRLRRGIMPFPDLARVVIVRPSRDSTNVTRITVNFGDSPNVIESSKDVPLEFGDMVEIPQRDHSLGDSPWWLTENQISSMTNYLHGTAHLAVNGQQADLPLDPWGYASRIGQVLHQPEAQRLLLASSDLSRVKVTRHDQKTGKESQWIVDDAQSNSMESDLCLRDGDVIEVPEKQ